MRLDQVELPAVVTVPNSQSHRKKSDSDPPEGVFTPFASSAFNALLIRWNGLDTAGFAAWEFLPGMRFGERESWWRGGTDRGVVHEGLDICWYRTVDGLRLSLGAGARVPVICAGEIVSVVADFLGASVFVAHESHDCRGRRLHTVYGHVEQRPGLGPGSTLADGDEVGTIAGAAGGKSAAPPHLHLTLALIDREGGPERLDWDALRDRTRVLLLDPLVIMKYPSGWSEKPVAGGIC